MAVIPGNITDEMIQQYIHEQEGDPIIDDSRFVIRPSYIDECNIFLYFITDPECQGDIFSSFRQLYLPPWSSVLDKKLILRAVIAFDKYLC